MFEVGNLRATISDIKPTLKSQGYSVTKTIGRYGETRYGVNGTKCRKACKRTCSK